MPLKRYSIDGCHLSKDKIIELGNHLEQRCFMARPIRRFGLFEAFLEETIDIYTISPIIQQCKVTEIIHANM